MRKFKAFLTSLMAAVVLVGVLPATPVFAEEEVNSLTLETNINKTLEIPLTLEASTETFYINGNIDPGDTLSADILFINESEEDIQVRIADVTDQLGTTDSQALLDVMDLTITVAGSPIYKGKHSQVTSPLTQWMTLKGGEALNMNVNIELPLWETDNRYQGSDMRVKYVFEARADVQLDSEQPAKLTEIIKTGVEEAVSSNPAALVIIIAAVAVVVAFVANSVSKKFGKKKDDDK